MTHKSAKGQALPPMRVQEVTLSLSSMRWVLQRPAPFLGPRALSRPLFLFSRNNSCVILNIWVFRLSFLVTSCHDLTCVPKPLCRRHSTPPYPPRFPSPYVTQWMAFSGSISLNPLKTLLKWPIPLLLRNQVAYWPRDELVFLCMLETPNLNRWILRNSELKKQKQKQTNLRELIGKQFDAKKKKWEFLIERVYLGKGGVWGADWPSLRGPAYPPCGQAWPRQVLPLTRAPSSVWIWRPMAAAQEDGAAQTSPLSWSQKKKSIICVANRHFYITNY